MGRQCKGKTKEGARCKNYVDNKNGEFCWRHKSQQDSTITTSATRCLGKNINGRRCRNKVKSGNYCWRHKKQDSNQDEHKERNKKTAPETKKKEPPKNQTEEDVPTSSDDEDVPCPSEEPPSTNNHDDDSDKKSSSSTCDEAKDMSDDVDDDDDNNDQKESSKIGNEEGKQSNNTVPTSSNDEQSSLPSPPAIEDPKIVPTMDVQELVKALGLLDKNGMISESNLLFASIRRSYRNFLLKNHPDKANEYDKEKYHAVKDLFEIFESNYNSTRP